MLTLVGHGHVLRREARGYALASTLAVRARSAVVMDMETHLAVYAGLMVRGAMGHGRTRRLGRVEGLGRRVIVRHSRLNLLGLTVECGSRCCGSWFPRLGSIVTGRHDM